MAGFSFSSKSVNRPTAAQLQLVKKLQKQNKSLAVPPETANRSEVALWISETLTDSVGVSTGILGTDLDYWNAAGLADDLIRETEQDMLRDCF